jgi:tRNA-splicing ligase RtcB
MIKLANNILSWCNNPEEGAIIQAKNIAEHPWLVGNVCLMPDTHEGYGMPIGGVVALENAICPNMVGVDIGCGMLAVETNLTDITIDQLKAILGGSKDNKGGIRANIPLGFDHHKKDVDHPLFETPIWDDTIVCKQEKDSARRQLGTLGGGNHFIEIQRGDDGHIWFMIHSGSRNLGYKVAKYYNDKAVELCKFWKHDTIVQNELAVLPKGTEEFEAYLREMNLCLEFAYENRQMMAKVIYDEFKRVIPEVAIVNQINIHHNYASIEHHYNRDVWVHRKGATLARSNTTGIIPGSQGTNSYIVQGLGNEASLCSCSHGAGRKMSRKKAQESLNLEEEKRKMDEKGILHAIRGKSDLDEAAGAYKDIDTVMEEQKDLVTILVKLSPLAVVKG